MNKPAGIDLVERARALAPLITREADEIERTRRLTPAVTQALIENGLYRALLPKSFGGSEASLEAFMQMQEEVAKADDFIVSSRLLSLLLAYPLAYYIAQKAGRVPAGPVQAGWRAPMVRDPVQIGHGRAKGVEVGRGGSGQHRLACDPGKEAD